MDVRGRLGLAVLYQAADLGEATWSLTFWGIGITFDWNVYVHAN